VTRTGPSLDQIDGRTPITAENTPGDSDSVFRIVDPGSYYLTADVDVPSGLHGIEVAARDVSIDLNGYTILGEGGSLDGVNAPSSDGMRVLNGRVRGVGGDGVHVRNEFYIRDLIISDITGGDAINCGGNNSSGAGFVGIIERCVITSVSGDDHAAIDAACCVLVSDCQFSFTSGDFAVRGAQSAHVRDSTFSNTRAGAIRVADQSSIVDCHVEFSFTSLGSGEVILVAGTGSLVRGNMIDATGYSVGVQVNGAANRIEDNHIVGRSITSTGSLNVIIGNTVSTAITATPGDLVGPIVTGSAGLATAPAVANIQY
jgi:hypothetical protein